MAKDTQMDEAPSLSKRALMPSGPEALDVSNDLNTSRTSSLSIVKVSSTCKGRFIAGSNGAFSVSMLHCCRKKELNTSALDLLSVI